MQTALRKVNTPTDAELVDRSAARARACVGWDRDLIKAGVEYPWKDAEGRPDPVKGVAARINAARTAIWALLYRPPKRVPANLYLGLWELYDEGRRRQMQLYQQERAETNPRTELGCDLIRAADRLAGQEMSVNGSDA